MSGFGSYELLEKVSEGTTGAVFRARQVELGRTVAVKQLAAAVRAVPGLLERFRGEAAVLAQLDDPHVVALLDYVEDQQRAWLVQEWVEGVSLSAVLEAHGRLSAEQALGVLRGGLLGLAHAHDRGVVHRDVAPNNILLDVDGTSKVVDFGLAAPVGSTGVCGTPAFISPEAAAGDATGPPGDVYSAAAVLFLLLTGQPPFLAANPAEMLRRHRNDAPPPLLGHGELLTDLVRRALTKDPAGRPPDARAFLDELEPAAAERYGAAWLSRAGVAGLVTSTLAGAGAGAGALTPGATGATLAGVAGATLQISTGSADTGPGQDPSADRTPPNQPAASAVRTSRRRLRLPRTPLAAVGVGLAFLVTAAAATAGTRALTSDDDQAAGASAPGPVEVSAAPTSSPSRPAPSPPAPSPPTPAVAVDLQKALTGTYAVQQTVVEAPPSSHEPVGTVRELIWTLAVACPATPCSGTMTSARGVVYQVVFDGRRLTGMSNRREEVPCYLEDTGEQIGMETIDSQNTADLELMADGPGSARLTGTLVSQATNVSAVPPCTFEPGSVRTYRSAVTGTRTS